MQSADPGGWLRLFQSIGSIRLGKGVVSQSTRVALVVLVVIGICAWRWSDDVIEDAGLALMALIAVGWAGWWTRETNNFAAKNPGQALLEGADLTRFHAQELKMRSANQHPGDGSSTLVEDHGNRRRLPNPESDR